MMTVAVIVMAKLRKIAGLRMVAAYFILNIQAH